MDIQRAGHRRHPALNLLSALNEITFLPGLFGSCGRGGLLVPLGHRLVQELVNGVNDVGPHEGETAETPAHRLQIKCNRNLSSSLN